MIKLDGQTGDILAFLNARLDEDERIARAVEDNSAPWDGQWDYDETTRLRTRNGWSLAYLPEGRSFAPGLLPHIARHDPARALADVTAKRAIIELYRDRRGRYRELADGRARSMAMTKPEPTDEENRCMDMSDAYLKALRLLALPYADHPDYREEWRP